MKSSVKKLFALLLAAVLVVSACGKQPAETTAATQQAPAPATEAPADKPSDPAPAQTTAPDPAVTTPEAVPGTTAARRGTLKNRP